MMTRDFDQFHTPCRFAVPLLCINSKGESDSRNMTVWLRTASVVLYRAHNPYTVLRLKGREVRGCRVGEPSVDFAGCAARDAPSRTSSRHSSATESS